MNLCKWVCCVAGVIFVKLAGAQVTGAHPGTPGELSIQGEIIEAACALDSRSRELWVDFGEVSAGSIISHVGATEAKPFQIMFTGCMLASKNHPDMPYQRANITFNTSKDSKGTQLISLNGDATGFGILIRDAYEKPITLGQPLPDYYLLNGDNELNFTASLIPDSNNINTGEFYANVSFFMDYL